MDNELQQDTTAKAEIDQLIASFFELFSNRNGIQPNLEHIFDLFVPQGLITKSSGQEPEISTLREFITPRHALLTNGTLTDFFEVETSESTFIFGNIAHRVSTYQKSGRLNGDGFSVQGMKTFQFIHTPKGWKIIAMAWDDERSGLTLKQAQIFGSLNLVPTHP